MTEERGRLRHLQKRRGHSRERGCVGASATTRLLSLFLCLGAWVAICGSPASGNEPESRWTAYETESLTPGQRPKVKLPVTFRVAAECYLYVEGQRVEEVFLAREGDELLLNGGVVFGPRRVARGRDGFEDLTEERCERLYRNVATIVRLVEQGATWKDAARGWNREYDRIVGVCEAAFADAIDAGLDGDGAAVAAASAGVEADTAKVFGDRGIRADGTNIVFAPSGYPGMIRVFQPPYARVVAEGDSVIPVSSEEIESFATFLYQHLSGDMERPCFLRLDGGGFRISTGPEVVRGILDQLQRAREDPGEYPAGDLQPYELKRILRGEGIEVGW